MASSDPSPALIRAPRGGFTLVELLLASALTALVLVAIGGFTTSARTATEGVRVRAEDRARLRRALRLLEQDLRAALPPGGVHAAGLTGEDATRDGGAALGDVEAEQTATAAARVAGTDAPPVEARDVLTITTAAGARRFGAEAPIGVGALPQVTWSVDDDDETEAQGLSRTVLVIRDPLVGAEEPVPDQVAPWVVGMDLSFRTGDEWQPAWDPNESDTLPEAVRVTLAVRGTDGVIRTERLTVALPAGAAVTELEPEGAADDATAEDAGS